ncbi:hypothetical protein NQ318_005625 [Aromia moschata]|uniref:Uncharacterized protein n=1 Tax=Aromia moschata TaxID=1265417 RepID=A0AAV8WZZ5_9CUCU|nr:hypothetical protein NQ318_005625 [Aromia moschata]
MTLFPYAQLLLWVFLLSVPSMRSYNILGVFPHPGKSHVDVFLPLMRGLANKGHNVTVISCFSLKDRPSNYKEVGLDQALKIFLNVIDMGELESNRLYKYTTLFKLSYFAQYACESGLGSKVVKDFMKTDQHFELLIIEFFNSDCFMGLNFKLE